MNPLASGVNTVPSWPTSSVMYTGLFGFETVTVTGVAVAVVVTCVPPALPTVTVALRLIVHVEVFPEVGAPKVTGPVPVAVAGATVLAFVPLVNVQL